MTPVQIVDAIRQQIREAKAAGDIPGDLRYTVSCRNYNSIHINVRGIQDAAKVVYYEHREIYPGTVITDRVHTQWAAKLEEKLLAMGSTYKHTICEDGDYGSIPNVYLHVHFIDPERGSDYR